MKYLLKYKNILIVSLLFILIIVSIISNKIEPHKNKIGIIKIDGTILESEKIIKQLNDFNKDDSIKGIILRINSPGGAVAPSQEIYYKVKNLADSENKPIIASISSLGASGGYYIAIGANRIIANPGSIIGSIGVIINYPVAKDLLDEIGLNFITHKSGEYKDSGSPYRYSNIDDEKYFELLVDDLYNQFVQEVSQERNISIKKVKQLADGSVYTGKMALKHKLIDSLGTFEDALNLVKKMTNIKGDIDLIYPKKDIESIFDFFSIDNSALYNFYARYMYKIPLYTIGE